MQTRTQSTNIKNYTKYLNRSASYNICHVEKFPIEILLFKLYFQKHKNLHKNSEFNYK